MLFALEELIIKSIKVPFSSRAVVDEERMLDLLEALRSTLPKEIDESKRLLMQRDELLEEAHRKAALVLDEARQAAASMVATNEIARAAEAEAQRVRDELALDLQQQQAGADRYADEVLAELEAKISRALTTIQNGRSQLGAT